MAGSGSGLTTWASSAAYHQDKGDYNDNVIVPRSILVDTADAIRIKKSGTAEVKSDVDVSGETFLASSSIAPIDFATEIGNIASLEFPTHGVYNFGAPIAIYRNGSANTNTKTIVGYTVKNTSQYTTTAADFQIWWDSVVFFGLTYCVYSAPNTDTYIAFFSKDHFYYCKKHNLPWFEAGWTIYNPNTNFKLGSSQLAGGNIYKNVNGSPINPFIAMSDLLNPHDADSPPWGNYISTSATPPTTHFHMYEKTTGTRGATTATESQKNPQNWYETLQYASIGNLYFYW